MNKFLNAQNIAGKWTCLFSLKVKFLCFKEEQANVSKDNSNSINHSKCWENEKHKIIENCDKCSKFLRKTLLACKVTGYIEKIECANFGVVSRSCDVPHDVQKRHFWLFEFFVMIFLSMSTVIVLRRKNFLDKKATERVRRQLTNE